MNKRQALFTDIKTRAQIRVAKMQSVSLEYIEKLKKMDPKKQRKFLLIGFGIGVLNFALSLFSLYTLLSFGIIVVTLAILIKINLAEIKKKGLIAYIPPKFHTVLLERSIFDIICDIWFVPKITLYIKALVSPFIVKIDPSEAVHQFKDFPPGARKAILTKGLVNIMPDFIKNNMLPPKEILSDESSEVSFLAENEDFIADQKDNKPLEIGSEILSNGNSSNKSTSVPQECLSPLKSGGNIFPNGFLNTSTDDDSLVNHRFNFKRQAENVTSKRIKKERVKSNAPKVEKKFLHDSENDLASEILNLNKVTKKSSSQVRVSETWDQLEFFTKMHREKLLKQKLGLHLPNKIVELKGPLQSVQKIAMLMNKEALLNKLESKRLTTVFVASSLALILQFSLSKKTRYWCYNTIHILLYITGITLSTGSLAALGIKMRTKYQKWKEVRAVKMLKEIHQIKESEE